MTIHIYMDLQDPQNHGWAWRDERDGSPLGSGPIDGDASEALTHFYEYGSCTEDERESIEYLVDMEIGCDRGMVTIQNLEGVPITTVENILTIRKGATP